MSFSTKRGRRHAIDEKDCGTLELQAKRRLNITKEPLDLWLERGIISLALHRAGLHFRWLYTLRYGAPTVSAVNWEYYYGKNLSLENPEWQAAREMEFSAAVKALRGIKAHKPVINLVVFNINAAAFCNKIDKKTAKKHAELRKIREGLKELAKLWGMK